MVRIYSILTLLLAILCLTFIPNVMAQRPAETATRDQGVFCDKGGINTAIGCIDGTPGGLATSIFRIGIGFGGGIAFLLILFGGFQILTSSGNPEQLNAGKELIVSAISGLLMIIFSVFLLRLIGVDILGLPDFHNE